MRQKNRGFCVTTSCAQCVFSSRDNFSFKFYSIIPCNTSKFYNGYMQLALKVKKKNCSKFWSTLWLLKVQEIGIE